MEKVARYIHSRLLRTFVDYGYKMFYNIGPRIKKGGIETCISKLYMLQPHNPTLGVDKSVTFFKISALSKTVTVTAATGGKRPMQVGG